MHLPGALVDRDDIPYLADAGRIYSMNELLGGDVAALGMSLDMPVEHGEEAVGAVGSLVGITRRVEGVFARHRRPLLLRARDFQGSQQISRGLGAGQQLAGEAQAKGPLEANEELRPAQAVEAEVWIGMRCDDNEATERGCRAGICLALVIGSLSPLV